MGRKALKPPIHTSPRYFSTMKNKSFANNSSPEVLLVGRFRSRNSYQKHQVVEIKDEEEEKTYVNGSKTRWLHRESSSTRDENISSPLCPEEADVDASPNRFIMDREKLVPLVIFVEGMDSIQRRGLSRSPSASIFPQYDNTMTTKDFGVRSYGIPHRGIRGNFVPPIIGSGNNIGNVASRNAGK
ncbi:hypothetical protein P3S68_007843 [Capsicum galapagoense]